MFEKVLEFITSNLYLSIGLAVALIILIFLIVSFSRAIHKDNHFEEKVLDYSNTTRLYVVDLLHDNIKYFDQAKLTHRKTSSSTEFYNQFPSDSRMTILKWISDLVDPETDTSKTLEVNVFIKKSKKTYRSLLEVKRVDYDKKLIYIDSYILKNIEHSHGETYKNYFLTMQEYEDKLLRNKNKGFTFSIKFFSKKNVGKANQAIVSQAKNVLHQFINDKCYISIYDENILVTNEKLNDKEEAITFIKKLETEINKFITVTSLDDTIGFSFGVVRNMDIGDKNEIILTVNKLAVLASENNQKYIFEEDEKRFDAINNFLNYRTEVEKIIQEKRLQYLFQPVYNLARKRIEGYIEKTKPIDSFFDDISELKVYAARTDDDKELFGSIAKTAIARFIEQKEPFQKSTLYFPVNYNELDYVNRTFSHIPNITDITVSLVLSEEDIAELPNESFDSILSSIRSIKSKGYEVSLLIETGALKLPPLVYESVDAFMIYSKDKLLSKEKALSIPEYENLLENLLHFEKHVIALNIPSWEYIELVNKLGIDRISSEVISPLDENVLPLSKKVITKLNSINS